MQSNFLVYLKLCLVSMIWGGTFVAGRYLADGAPPLFVSSIRFWLASAALAIFLGMKQQPLVRINMRQFVQLLALGFFGIFAYNLCFFYGLHYISASRASLIVALNPAVMALIAYTFFNEKLSVLKIISIALCLFGAAMIIISKQAPMQGATADSGYGDMLLLGCVISWGIYSVFSKNLSASIGALHAVSYSIWFGTAMLTAMAVATGQFSYSMLIGLRLPAIVSLAYLGIIGSALAYILYYDCIQKIGATRSGVFIALNPLTAVFLGTVILDESLTVPMFIGGGLVIVGIILCNLPARPKLHEQAAPIQTPAQPAPRER
ncbi:DMT family transporter [Jeongeupia wiesaeckerbachi]|uniref:DMT family transporter n=1 Tax=Jeongeupia wiesaeckerbachi TaxID=3051218 RepID=UPI003D8016B3